MATFIPPEGLHVVRRDAPGQHRTFRLLRDHLVATDTVRIVLPEGFEFDGASIPTWLRPVVAACDPWGRYEYPAAAHDLLYATQRTSREEADLVFRILLVSRGVPRLARLLLYYAVRLFGQKSWDRGRALAYAVRTARVETKRPEQNWSDLNTEGIA